MDDEYKNFFFNKEYLESIYNVLKSDDKELKRETIKNYIETIEGVEYEGIYYIIKIRYRAIRRFKK